MAKYILRRGIARLPIDGVREIPRDGLPPQKQGETVVFESGVVVDTDLDFGSWVEDGTLVRLRENNEPPRPPKPVPVSEVKKEILTPMPAFVQVEVVKETAPVEGPTEDAVEEPVVEGETPSETPRRRRGR